MYIPGMPIPIRGPKMSCVQEPGVVECGVIVGEGGRGRMLRGAAIGQRGQVHRHSWRS